MKGVGQLKGATFDMGDGEDVFFVNEVVGPALGIDSEVAVSQLVAIDVLVVNDVWAMRKSEGGVRKGSNMNFVGGESSGSADEVFANKLDMR